MLIVTILAIAVLALVMMGARNYPAAIALIVVIVWVATMQPADAATIRTATTMNGVTYYDTMTTNPDESYNGATRDTRALAVYKYVDGQCRGGNGDSKRTQEFCKLRDEIDDTK